MVDFSNLLKLGQFPIKIVDNQIAKALVVILKLFLIDLMQQLDSWHQFQCLLTIDSIMYLLLVISVFHHNLILAPNSITFPTCPQLSYHRASIILYIYDLLLSSRFCWALLPCMHFSDLLIMYQKLITFVGTFQILGGQGDFIELNDYRNIFFLSLIKPPFRSWGFPR